MNSTIQKYFACELLIDPQRYMLPYMMWDLSLRRNVAVCYLWRSTAKLICICVSFQRFLIY